MLKWHPDGRCRLHNAGSSAHIVYTAETSGMGDIVQGIGNIYIYKKKERRRKEKANAEPRAMKATKSNAGK